MKVEVIGVGTVGGAAAMAIAVPRARGVILSFAILPRG